MKIIGVTACPTGIAHTYMAATRLINVARAQHHEIKLETQGAMGIEHVLTAKDVDTADLVIIAADIPISGEERFSGRQVLRVSTLEAIGDPQGVLQLAIDKAAAA